MQMIFGRERYKQIRTTFEEDSFVTFEREYIPETYEEAKEHAAGVQFWKRITRQAAYELAIEWKII